LVKLHDLVDTLLQAARGIWEIAKHEPGLGLLMDVDVPAALWPVVRLRAEPWLQDALAQARAFQVSTRERVGSASAAAAAGGEGGGPSPAKKPKREPAARSSPEGAPAPPPPPPSTDSANPSPDQLENPLNDPVASCCYTLSVLALKVEYQERVAQPGAVEILVSLLRAMVPVVRCGDLAAVIPGPEQDPGQLARHESTATALQKVVETVTNLSHERTECKDLVRTAGGIAPLAELLKSSDRKLQRSTAAALRTLAFKNDKNKDLIVECGAVSTLVCLLYARDAAVHNEAVGAIGNLVHSCPKIKTTVLKEGALQPIIKLLQSSCPESRKEAALLLGQFATVQDPDFKSKIVQRGALPPLVQMLSAADPQLQEMAAFAIGRLAQNNDNQAGLVHHGAIPSLLKLLACRVPTLQHNAAFAIYGVSDNPENVCDLLVQGVVHCLQRTQDFESQASKDCAKKTLGRLEDKVAQVGSVTKRLCHILVTGSATERLNVAVSLAHLCPRAQLGKVFASHGGFHILMQEILALRSEGDSYLMCLLSRALDALAEKSGAKYSAFRDPPASSLPGAVFLGAKYVDSPEMADCRFSVQQTSADPLLFYGHKAALEDAAPGLADLVCGAQRDKDHQRVCPDGLPLAEVAFGVSASCFRTLLKYAYTGVVDFEKEAGVDGPLEELARAAHRFRAEGLQTLCEAALKKSLSQRNIMAYYELGGQLDMRGLQEASMLYAIEHMATEVAKKRDGSVDQFIFMIKIFSAQLREYFLPFIAKCA